MANSSHLLTEWTDPEIGHLRWHASGVWQGICEINGQKSQLSLDPDNTDPTVEEQLAVIESSRAILKRLPDIEPELRRQAAAQIALDLISMQVDETDRVILPEDRFAKWLILESVSIHGCGELHYRFPEFFLEYVITIYFNADLTFGDAEMYER